MQITISLDELAASDLLPETKHELFEWLWANELITDATYQQMMKVVFPE